MFLNPLFLAGLALIAVPIVLHLIMRRKPKLLEFPALRLIQKRHDTNQRRLQLRHLLLLLLRAGAIALLALAFARPSVRFEGRLGSQEAPVAAALVFDAAPRMDYRQGNESRLQAVKEIGLGVLAKLPPQSAVAVLDTRLGPAAFQVDRGAAKQRITQLEVVSNSQPLPAVIDEALRLLSESELKRKELYIFTDLARGAWPAEGAARMRKRLAAAGVGVYLIDKGVAKPVNTGLGEMRLSSQVIPNHGTLVLSTDLQRTDGPGDEAPQNRTVELFVLDENRQPQKRSQESYALGAGDTQQIEFHLGGLGVGTHQGFVRLVGEDALKCDDTRYFTVSVTQPWRVLLCAPKPASHYARFLAEALAPETFRKRGQARFECDTIALDDLPQRDLRSYAAVCLLDPTPLEAALWKKLADYAAEGGGVGVFLGRNAKQIETFAVPEAQEILAGKLVRQAKRPDGEAYLAPKNYEHPILAAFRSQSGAIPWEAFPVFRFWQIHPPAKGVSTILALNDQSPILLEKPIGLGRALTMTTPISDRADAKAWNLLPVGMIDNAGPFVILANQMLAYLVGSADEQFNYACGQPATLILGTANLRRTFTLTTPGGVATPLALDPQQGKLSVSATDEPGNYRIQSGGSADGLATGFSVNLSTRQTALERLSPPEVKELFAGIPHQMATTLEQIDRGMSEARTGRELFGPLVFALALVLAAEWLVANRFYRE